MQCVRRSLEHPIENHDVNATGTLIVLEAARRHKVQRLIYCSSSEVYGNCGAEWLSEETPCVPVTVYGAAKLAVGVEEGEQVLDRQVRAHVAGGTLARRTAEVKKELDAAKDPPAYRWYVLARLAEAGRDWKLATAASFWLRSRWARPIASQA